MNEYREERKIQKSIAKELFYLLFRKRYWILSFVIISLVGVLVHHKKYPKYKSIAKIYIQAPESNPTVSALARLGGTQINPYSEVSLAGKYLKILSSNTFNQYFMNNYLKDESTFESLKEKMNWKFSFSKGDKKISLGGDIEREQFVDYVLSKTRFRKEGSDIISILVVTKNVEESVVIANLMSDVAKKTLFHFESKELGEIADYLNEEINNSKERMSALNKGIVDINRKKKVNRLKGGNQAQLTNVTYEKLESELEGYRVKESEIDILIKKYKRSEQALYEKGLSAGVTIDRDRRDYNGDKIEKLKEEKEFARARISALKDHLKTVSKRVDNSSSIIFEYEKQLEIEISFFNMLKKNLFENQFQRISLKNKVRSYDNAYVKSAYRDVLIAPKLLFTIVLSFSFITLLLWGWEYIDPLVTNKENLVNIGFEYIGFVPPLKEKTKFFKEVADNKLLLCRPEIHSIHSISFHNIRAKIQQVLRQKQEKTKSTVISTISSHSGEGKSFVSSNLALSFGSVGNKTIIIDCDYRRSSLSGVFHTKKKKGLVEFLKGGVSLKEILNKDIYNNTDYISAGDSEDFNLNSFTVERIREFLDHLKSRYEVIVLDTPAYLSGPEALMLSEQSDFRLFIACSNQTRQQDAFDAFSGLYSMGGEKVYAVLNKHDLLFKSNPYSQYFSSTGEYLKINKKAS